MIFSNHSSKIEKKSIPWFIHIDLISDLIDDLINLIKSMPNLPSCVYKSSQSKQWLLSHACGQTNKQTVKQTQNKQIRERV